MSIVRVYNPLKIELLQTRGSFEKALLFTARSITFFNLKFLDKSKCWTFRS